MSKKTQKTKNKTQAYWDKNYVHNFRGDVLGAYFKNGKGYIVWKSGKPIGELKDHFTNVKDAMAAVVKLLKVKINPIGQLIVQKQDLLFDISNNQISINQYVESLSSEMGRLKYNKAKLKEIEEQIKASTQK